MGSRKTVKKRKRAPAPAPGPPPAGPAGFAGYMVRAVGAALLVGIGRKLAIDIYDSLKGRLSRRPRKRKPQSADTITD